MTVHSPQTTAHGEVIEIRSQVAHAQDGAVEAVPAYYTPDTLIADLMDELAEGREMVAYLTRANEALTAERDQWVKHTRNAVWADSEELKQAEAEVVRLRACVDAVMADRKLIMEARICRSCHDSLYLPSGDGCANMTAHDPLGRVITVNVEDL